MSHPEPGPVCGSCPLHSICDYFLDIRLVVNGEGFMPRPEVEYFTLSPVIAAAASEDLSAGKPAYKYQGVGGWNIEAFPIHFLPGNFNIFVYALHNWVSRLYYPQSFLFPYLPPFKVTFRAHQPAEYLGEMPGMQHNKAHAFKYPLMYLFHYFITNLMNTPTKS